MRATSISRLALAALLATAQALPAQAVRGRVLDRSTGAPLAGAIVTLVDGVGLPIAEAAASDAGRFRLAVPAPGDYLLRARSIGYTDAERRISVAAGETHALDLRLAPDPVALEGVDVRVENRRDRWLRRVGGRTAVLTRADIEPVLPRARHVGDLLRSARIPGLVVREWRLGSPTGPIGLCVTLARNNHSDAECRMMQVFLDDGPFPYPAETLLDLDPENIERIEVLSPLEAGVEYGGRTSHGVLLIYTRGYGGR